VIASSVTKHDLPIAPMRDILLRNRTGEYSCREQACRNLTDLDTMLRAAFACHIVQKPACGTCAREGLPNNVMDQKKTSGPRQWEFVLAHTALTVAGRPP
jgi:hypothetical protein